MKFTCFLIIILFVFTAFIMSMTQQEYSPSRGEQLVNMILGKTAKIIKDKYNIRPCGVGASMPRGPIRSPMLCFDTNSLNTKEELRELIIKSGGELLKQVNENDEIQQYLKERPFTLKNIQIIIYNHDQSGSGVRDPEISTAQISEGNLIYRTIDPLDSYKFKNEYEETYAEALNALSKPLTILP